MDLGDRNNFNKEISKLNMINDKGLYALDEFNTRKVEGSCKNIEYNCKYNIWLGYKIWLGYSPRQVQGRWQQTEEKRKSKKHSHKKMFLK